MARNYLTRHSSIDKLPKDIRVAIRRMMVDNEWPDNFKGNKIGKPRYVDMADYVTQRGHHVSEYAIGRYCRRHKALASMKDTGKIVAEAMRTIDGANISEAQKAAGELLTALILETITGEDNFSSKEIQNLARAAKDCTQVVVTANKYINQQMQERAVKAKEDVRQLKPQKEISPDALRFIKEQVYGIIDNHLGISQP